MTSPDYGELVKRLIVTWSMGAAMSWPLYKEAADAIEQQARELTTCEGALRNSGNMVRDLNEEVLRLKHVTATLMAEWPKGVPMPEWEEPAENPKRKFKKGDRVRKIGGDYTFDGIVVCDFQKRSGKWRYVVEDDRGLLLIHSEKTLEIDTRGTDTPEHGGMSG